MILHIVGSILCGLLLADFVTGLVHWWEDRLGNPAWPFIGRHVIAPNRLHHDRPMAFTETSFFQRNWTSAIASLSLGFILAAIFGPSLLLATAVTAGCIANEVHYFTHKPLVAPSWIRILQNTGFLQSPRGHARHHKAPQNSDYCSITDWLNPWLQKAGLWDRLDRLFGVASPK